MVNSPIKVKEFINPIISSRHELLKEEDEKITGRRGIILKGFQTEKQRIQEHLNNLNFIFQGGNNNDIIPEKHIIDNEGIIRQPEMRFKPRTDLERVYDEVNKINMGRISKFVIDKQLRELDLNTVKRSNTNAMECIEFKNNLPMIDKMKNSRIITNENELEKVDKNSKCTIEEKKKKMNQDSKNMISELHEKTHFKGASEIANNCCNMVFIF
jgi:hypothetical protein